MSAPNDAKENEFSSIATLDDFSTDWDDDEDTEEFDMEAYWDADAKTLKWEWENPWMLEPRQD